MRKVAVDPEHPTNERDRPLVLVYIAVEFEDERARTRLRDSRNHRFTDTGECSNVLTVRRE